MTNLRRKSLWHRCVTTTILVLAALQIFAQTDELVPVTARYTVSKKKQRHHNYRLQIKPGVDSVSIMGFGIQKMHRSFRMLRSALGKEKITREQLEESASAFLDSSYSFLKRQKDLSYRIPSASEYTRLKSKFFSGKISTPFFPSQWISLATLPHKSGTQFEFTTRGMFRTHHSYIVDNLPGALAFELPATDPFFCQPAELRFFQLRKLQGYGVGKITYTPFKTQERINFRKGFEVYFQHNQTKPDEIGMREVISYLDQNNYVIIKAELQGGCSLEGDLARNRVLQAQRAKVLQTALHKYSDELLKRDTVTLVDFVGQFRTLIKSTPHSKLDTLSDEALILRVNTDEKLQSSLEEIFVLQRKASLKLIMAKRLTREEQVEKFLTEFNKAISTLVTPKTINPQHEQRLMGMIEVLFKFYSDGLITVDDLVKAIDESWSPEIVYQYLGYHLLHTYEDRNSLSIPWTDYWKKFQVHMWLDRAQERTIQMVLSARDQNQKNRYLRMLVDFQAYRYDFVQQGLIDIQELCDIPYPETQEFMGLILNQYAFLYEAAAHREKDPNDEAGWIYCVPSRSKRSVPKDSTINTEAFIDEVMARNNTVTYALSGNNRLVLEKSFDNSTNFARSPFDL